MKELTSNEVAIVSGGDQNHLAGDILNTVGSALDFGAQQIGVFVSGYEGISGPILHGVGDGVNEFADGHYAQGVTDILSGVSKGVSAGINDGKLVWDRFASLFG